MTHTSSTVVSKKILAISSGGGHWEQLMILNEALEGQEVVYATTVPGLAEKAGVGFAHLIADCNRTDMAAILRCLGSVFVLIRRERPDLIVTTGAAPGFIALCLGKMFGARTIWIDSIANSEKLSMSGRLAHLLADLHLTQWEHLAGMRTRYLGSVL